MQVRLWALIMLIQILAASPATAAPLEAIPAQNESPAPSAKQSSVSQQNAGNLIANRNALHATGDSLQAAARQPTPPDQEMPVSMVSHVWTGFSAVRGNWISGSGKVSGWNSARHDIAAVAYDMVTKTVVTFDVVINNKGDFDISAGGFKPGGYVVRITVTDKQSLRALTPLAQNWHTVWIRRGRDDDSAI